MGKRIYLTEAQFKELVAEWGRKNIKPTHYSMDDKLELVDDPNIKDGGNFAIKRNGKMYWVSRSNTISLYVFAYDRNGRMYVLASKRGPKASSGSGMWNIVAGFLDYGYSLEDTAVKECWEETGVKVNKDDLINAGTNSSNVNREVNTRFILLMKDLVENHPTSIANCEDGEVSEAKWIPVDEVQKYRFWGKQGESIIELSNRLIQKKGINFGEKYADFMEGINRLLNDGVINNLEYTKIMNIVKN